MQQLYTIKQVAAAFVVSEKTVRRLIKNGMIKASKIGAGWRMTESDIEEFRKRRVLKVKPKGFLNPNVD